MKLISCHIENFGHLRNFDYVFSDGINVICRENGWGKSTFAAFLLAMFYGLPSKGKKRQAVSSGSRLPLQNARSACRPWQGGVFGGQLIFEAGGRTYEITRVFGDREGEDEFDLRDPDTNLPCFDYTKEIGKELFLLDRESFLRTVFTSQQDCLTEATDDVNALITNLAEYAGDMERYESAQKRLKEACSRLTPKRAAGRLRLLEDRISQLERTAAAGYDLEEGIALCGREQNELKQRQGSLEREYVRLEKELAAAEHRENDAVRAEEADRSLFAKKQIRQRLYQSRERRREVLEKTSAYFPGRVPVRTEVDDLLKACREMERLEERIKAGMLTRQEQERLNILEERFSDSIFLDNPAYPDDPAHLNDPADDTDPMGETASANFSPGAAMAGGMTGRAEKRRREKAEKAKKAEDISGGTLIALAGILLILIAVGMTVFLLAAGASENAFSPAAVAAAILLAGAGAGAAVFGALKRTSSLPSSDDHRQEKESVPLSAGEKHEPSSICLPGKGMDPSVDKNRSEEDARAYAEYAYLSDKEQKLEQIHADWAQARKPILRFLKELGFSPEKDLHAQLTSIRDAADDCEDARALLRESDEELRLFDEELRRSGLTLEMLQSAGAKKADKLQEQAGESGQSMAALRRRREEVREELLRCRAQEADAEGRMEDLIREREDREELLEELKVLRAQQCRDQTAYRQITMASDLLQRAKESLTSRYADPIRTSFSRYWEMITGHTADDVYVDANSNITIEEGGKQRDAASFSTGLRDLAGICLRTALADAMYPTQSRERPPLILDDPFTNLDDGKIEGAMHFLKEAGRHYQILYFTCSITRC